MALQSPQPAPTMAGLCMCEEVMPAIHMGQDRDKNWTNQSSNAGFFMTSVTFQAISLSQRGYLHLLQQLWQCVRLGFRLHAHSYSGHTNL